jgi:hypothetical protein
MFVKSHFLKYQSLSQHAAKVNPPSLAEMCIIKSTQNQLEMNYILLMQYIIADTPQLTMGLHSDKLSELKISEVKNAFNIPNLPNIIAWQCGSISCLPLRCCI